MTARAVSTRVGATERLRYLGALLAVSALTAACGGGGGGGSSDSGGSPPAGGAPAVLRVTELTTPMFSRTAEFAVEGTNLDSSEFSYVFSGACTRLEAGARTSTRYVLRCLADAIGDISLALANSSTKAPLGSSPYTWSVPVPQVTVKVGNDTRSESVTVTLNAGSRGSADNDWALHFLYFVNSDFYPGTALHLSIADGLVEGGCYKYQSTPLKYESRPGVTARALPGTPPSSSAKNIAGTLAIGGPHACDSTSTKPAGTIWPTFALNIADNSASRLNDRDAKEWTAIGKFSDSAASTAAAKALSALPIPRAANNFCPFPNEACYWPDWVATPQPATEILSVTQVR